MKIAQAFHAAEHHYEAGRMDEAEAGCRQILAVQPWHAEALHLLGLVAARVGQAGVAQQCISQAIALRPATPAYHSNLSAVLLQQGQPQAAVAAARTACRLAPDVAGPWMNLGNALLTARELDPAVAAYREALRLDPAQADAHNNLGIALVEQGRLEAACGEFGEALRLCPESAGTLNNLATALRELGQLDEALEAYRQATELAPEDARIHSGLVYSLHFRPGDDGGAIAAEAGRWNLRHGRTLASARSPHANAPEPGRRLKIGYVSADFQHHAVAFYLVPLFEAHDRSQVEIHCYSSVPRPDAVTAHLRSLAAVWREVGALSDAALAEQIRRDGVDILIDLSLHTAEHRLLTFAGKPAPVQASWLAYPGSTGLETMDYRIMDAHLEPEGTPGPGGGEQPIRLPGCSCCYQPIGDFPEVGPLPAAEAGYVTFGSLNKFSRINDAVLGCWAAVLLAVPRSRLLMFCPEGRSRGRVGQRLGERGIASDRVEFVGWRRFADYLALCGRMDVLLDAFPCNGMTTTCHALWMGVPVVSLAGERAVSRAGLSVLTAVGLPELVARTEAEYCQIAGEVSRDVARLAELRGSLRTRMKGSRLMDARRFARDLEAAYRAMWERWCERGGKPRVP